jgi:hypothetical protein
VTLAGPDENGYDGQPGDQRLIDAVSVPMSSSSSDERNQTP